MDSKALQYIKKLGPLIGLILLFIIISVMNDSFLEFSNLRNLLRQVSINAIIAFGMTFVILTGGIDIGAKRDIYDLMNELTNDGVSIIMVSSELPEVLGMSDRVMVIHEGRVAGILDRCDATPESIMTLATGGQ